MTVSRRRMLFGAASGAAAFVLTPNMGWAQRIQADTQGTVMGTPYQRFSDAGPNAVTKAAVTLPGRLQMMVWLPAGVHQPLPVIFSHAELADPGVYDGLLTGWASHGAVVMAPVHSDAMSAGSQDIDRTQAWHADIALRRKRIDDCVAALDFLPVFRHKTGVDVTSRRPVVAGQSLGAHTAAILLGLKADFAAADPRPFAGVLVSSHGPGIWGVTPSSYGAMSCPLLVVNGRDDIDSTGQSLADRMQAYELPPPGHKHSARLPAATFSMLTGQRAGGSQDLTGSDLRAVTTAFLQAYGQEDVQTLDELCNGYFDGVTSGRIRTAYR